MTTDEQMRAAIRLLAEMEQDFAKGSNSVILAIVSESRREYAEAMVRLTQVPPLEKNLTEIQRLQNLIARHLDLVEWLRKIENNAKAGLVQLSLSHADLEAIIFGSGDPRQVTEPVDN